MDKASFDAGFDFGRGLAAPGFRERLKAIGAGPGQEVSVIPAVPSTSVADIMRRLRQVQARALLAIQDESEPDGWLFAWIEEPFVQIDGERAYVSRLWAEDWDSPEDSAENPPKE